MFIHNGLILHHSLGVGTADEKCGSFGLTFGLGGHFGGGFGLVDDGWGQFERHLRTTGDS